MKSKTDDNQLQSCNKSSEEQLQESPPESIYEDEPSSQFELWLDLRQTSMSPQAALLHLTNDLWDEYVAPQHKSFLVDKVLVNNVIDEQHMRRLLNDIMDEYEDEIEVLFQLSDGSISSFQSKGAHDNDVGSDDISIGNVGMVFQIYDEKTGNVNVYVNPMPALETISSGEWLVLDSSGVEDNNEKSEAIQSLVQLCQGGLITTMTGNEDKKDSQEILNQRGGIVIDCSSNPDIFQAGALIKSLSGNNKSYVTTESGILLKSSQNDKAEASTFKNDSRLTKYALLIPFDALLWKTASFVVNDQSSD